MTINKNILKIKSYIKSLVAVFWARRKKVVFWLNVFLIFVPPIVLAIPFPPYLGIYHIAVVPLENAT